MHDGNGKGVGSALYWDNSIKMEVLSHGMGHFFYVIVNEPRDPKRRGTFVYGEPSGQDRHHM